MLGFRCAHKRKESILNGAAKGTDNFYLVLSCVLMAHKRAGVDLSLGPLIAGFTPLVYRALKMFFVSGGCKQESESRHHHIL